MFGAWNFSGAWILVLGGFPPACLSGFQPIELFLMRTKLFYGSSGLGACVPVQNMKRLFCLLSLAGSLAGLLATTGCEVEEHGRGGYYGPHEYGYGHEWHHDGDWDRGHYYYHHDDD
jgi:hypothetical protein